MDNSSDVDDDQPQLHLELYFLIAKFLSAGPCKKAAETLQEELKHNKLLPRRVDWEGKEHFRSFQNLLQIYRHISPTHLAEICRRIGPILDKEIPPSVKGVTSLLGAGRQSLLRKHKDAQKTRWWNTTYTVRSHGLGLLPSITHSLPSFTIIHSSREKSGTSRKELTFGNQMFGTMSRLSKSLGHLSAVYCVLFDRTGTIIITGADDHLVKIWSAITGRLFATLRGHAGEVSDMAVNYENTLLATGSCDKTIRVWCLRSTSPVAILHAHTGMITSIQFCPYRRDDSRFLASTGGDGCVCFWTWNVKTNVFNPKPQKFIERSRAGAQMLCSSFSPGGIFLATGNSDHVVRVYSFVLGVPEKICELEVHSDRVDSIQYSHQTSRFISGSKDGTARVWRYDRQQWKALVLYMAQKPGGTVSMDELKASKLRLTMVAWTADDRHVLTAVSDYTIKVWNSSSGEVLKVLEGHQNEVFVLEHNPVHQNILLSAGHDGYIMVWDMFTGEILYKYFNVIQGQGHGAVFDCKWCPDGLSFAATDSHGFLLYFGFGSCEKYAKCPEEQFFHTDYRPLIRDSNNYVLDEQTQQPPHLMAPGFLVDIDGNPHPPITQRLVPGREDCTDQHLVPMMGTANNGDREVLDESVADAQAAEAVLQPPTPSTAGIVPPTPSTAGIPPPTPGILPENDDDDDIIDHMIDRLQREQDERIAAEGGEPLLSPSIHPQQYSPRAGPTADHDYFGSAAPSSSSTPAAAPAAVAVGGSRSPRASTSRRRRSSSSHEPRRRLSSSGGEGPSSSIALQAGSTMTNISVWNKRKCVPKYDPALIRKDAEFREYMAEEEIKNFITARKKKPIPQSERLHGTTSAPREHSDRRNASPSSLQADTGSDNSAASYIIRTRRKKSRRSNHGYRTRSNRNEETATNRLVTRALYDTDVEEYSTPQDMTQEEEEEEEVTEELNSSHVMEEEEVVHSDEMWKDTSNSESSDYSDWAEEGGTSIQPPKRQSQRAPKRRRWNDSDEPEEEEEEEEEQEEEEEEEVETSIQSPEVKHSSRKPPVKAKRKESRKQRNKRQVMNQGNRIRELPEAFRPPEWLTECVPRKTPYHPQIGDELVYFRQGHSLYLNAVKSRGIYKVDLKKNQPWHKNSNLREQELVKVTGIKYEIRPPRLVCLKLSFIDSETSRLTGGHFTIKYHDMLDVIDFLVLRQTYDTAISRNWKPGDRFRCMIDDVWWIGVIDTQVPFQEEFQDSMFQSVNVLWDNGEHEKMSPWDLEPLDDNRFPSLRGGSVPITDEEISAVLYQPSASAGEWPSHGRDLECERISQGLEQIMELAVAEWFLAPVDLNAFPIYGMVIEYPIDLSLIRARIDNKFYRRVAAIQYDVRLVEQNARSFNEAGTDIVKNAKTVTELCLRLISDTSCTDIRPLYSELSQKTDMGGAAHSDGDTDEETGTRANTRSRGALRSRRLSSGASAAACPLSSRRPSACCDPEAWKTRCSQLLNMILEHDDSAPFRAPVNIAVYPDYLTVIDTPMDFGTMRETLAENGYHNPQEVTKDARLVFHNSKSYNTNTRSRIYAMTLRLSAMFEDKMSEIVTEWKLAKRQGKTPMQQKRQQKTSSKQQQKQQQQKKRPPRLRISPSKSSSRVAGGGGGAEASASRRMLSSPVTPPSTSVTDSPRPSRLRPGSSSGGGSSSTATTSSGGSSLRSAFGLRKREKRPQRGAAAKKRRIEWDSNEEEEKEVVKEEEDEESDHKAAASDSETEVDEHSPELGGGGKSTRKNNMLGRLKALKRHASSSLVNGNSKKENGSKVGSSHHHQASPRTSSPRPTAASTSGNKRYTTRMKTGAVHRRRYDHHESDEEVSPRSSGRGKKPTTQEEQLPASDSEREEDENEEDDVSTSSDSSDKENNEESDSGTEEYSADEIGSQQQQQQQQKQQTVSTKSASTKRKQQARTPVRKSPEERHPRATRNKGQRTVTYEEDSDMEPDEPAATSVSSRGRVRKISARVRGAMFGD